MKNQTLKHGGNAVQKISQPARNPITDVATMQRELEIDRSNIFADDPISKEFLLYRLKFSKEEYEETLDAVERGDADGVVDGIIDQVVVLLGTLELCGVDVFRAWSEVHGKNMMKHRGFNERRAGSFGFDLVKPEGWTPPNHLDNLGDLEELLTNQDDDFWVTVRERLNEK